MVIFNILLLLMFDMQCAYCQIGRKAAEKCFEYRRIGNNLEDEYDDGIIFPTIIGGTRADRGEFPHMAALGYGPSKRINWSSGGTLISEYFVLTAAHSLYSINDGNVTMVRLGTSNIEIPDRSYRDYTISNAIRHPNYTRTRNYNDIALLRLSRAVSFNRYIKPACLQLTRYFNSSTLRATGWGSEYAGGQMVADLQQVGLVLYDTRTCNRTYSSRRRQLPNGILFDSMICAGGRWNKSQDTCIGDSGGPLQIYRTQYYVVGVTSFGISCGIINVPAIYTRVSNYIGWIEKTTWFTNYRNY